MGDLAIFVGSMTAKYARQQVHAPYAKVGLLYTIIIAYLAVWPIAINVKVPAHAAHARVDIH